MIWLVAGIGGTVEWHAPLRPDAGATVEVRSPSAIVVAAGAAALGAVSTALSAAAAEGDAAISLASAIGVVAGTRMLIQGTGVRAEPAIARSVSGGTVTLETRLAYAHPDSAPVQSTRLSYALAGASCPDPTDNWLATFTWASGAVAQSPHAVRFGVSRYGMHNPVTPILLQRLVANLRFHVPDDLDWQDICDRAFDEACEWVTSRGVPIYDYRGAAQSLERPASYCGLLLLAEQFGAAFAGQREELRARRDETVDLFCRVAAADVDRDRVITSPEEHGRVGSRAIERRR